MKNPLTKFTTLIFMLLSFSVFAQKSDTLFVAFWNLENFFDTVDDPNKNDEEFLPTGDKEWTKERLDIKENHHAKVIRSMNNGEGPDLLGVCEVEHQSVLDSMISKYLDDKNYKVAYLESPDNRGIDNGLIYDSNKFKVLSVIGDTVHLSDDWPTRLILNVNLLMNNDDTLIVYVNHWPSRRGGEEKSEPNRVSAAETLRKSVDKDFENNPEAKIIIIGDFNDEPGNNSILYTLNANPVFCDSLPLGEEFNSLSQLFNVSYKAYNDGLGTYKYRDDWNLLDQIMVSGDLLKGNDIKYVCNSYEVYKPNTMVTHSGNYKGAPFPTYGGKRYLGGYSDHYPATAKFLVEEYNK
ncbi:hypothetical protein LJE86_12120 [bacterium BMS3Abin03]|nr:hypothetical protein [bacterium BMS3Abin03]MCG6960323.1 hypothetical protein [bacterium BMS3Abin03]